MEGPMAFRCEGIISSGATGRVRGHIDWPQKPRSTFTLRPAPWSQCSPRALSPAPSSQDPGLETRVQS